MGGNLKSLSREEKLAEANRFIESAEKEVEPQGAEQPDEDLVRLNFQVSPETRQKIKIAAVSRGLTLRDYMLGLLRSDLGDETLR